MEQPENPIGNKHLKDLIAGLSLAGLLLPEAVAYSGIANLPPHMGIVALLAGLVCYALLGSSRFAIVSATSSSAAVLAAATASSIGDPAHRLMLTSGLVLFTGVFFVLGGLARMGNISDFIAKPVLRGFTFGLTIVIILKQLPLILGVQAHHASLLLYVPDLLAQMPAWNPYGIAIGACALLLLSLCSRMKNVPGALIVIVLGIAASRWLDLQQHGVGIVGDIHLTRPVPVVPQLSSSDWMQIAELAVAMLMILYAESYGSIRSFAIKHGDTVKPNQDLLALGAANICSGLLQGLPVGAGYSATSANEAAGAISRQAGAAAAITIFLIVILLLPQIALTPEPVLAAIVIHAVGHTLRLSALRPYFQWRRDRFIVIASIFSVLLLGVLDGLMAAVGVSILLLLHRFSESRLSVLGRLGQGHDFVSIDLHPDATPVEGIVILRPEEPLFFANVDRILSDAKQNLRGLSSPPHTIILSLEESPDLDSTTLEGLHDFAGFVHNNGQLLLLARLKDAAQSCLKRADFSGLPPSSISGLSVDGAVQVALAARLSRQGTP